MVKSPFNYFYFTRSERIGTFILCVLIVCSIVAPVIHQYWLASNNPPTFIKTPAIAIAPSSQEANQFSEPVMANAVEEPTDYFYFDPNKATKEEFLRLGISPKVSQTILNFRSKGGQFYKAADLKKIYGLSEKTYERLAPYVNISMPRAKESLVNKKPVSLQPTVTNEEKESALRLSQFDPNTINREQLVAMGIPEKISATLINYRNKGGRFYKKEDVAKIYGLSPALFDSLAPFIQIKAIEIKPRVKKYKSIDINQASIEDWEQLPGIGHYYANLIMSFRFSLGGFHSIEQVAETYGLKDSTYQLIRPYLNVSSPISTININKASIEKLNSHPYLKFKQAKAIVTYREQHGNYTTLKTLSRLPAIKPDQLEKVLPYLRID